MAIASFKKGLETKTRILQTAKKLFYNKGYTLTTVKEICNIAEVRTGTFAYYFKTKDMLINSIYDNLLVNCDIFVSNNINRKINSLEKNTIVSFLYYQTIFKDEPTIEFHREVIEYECSSDYLQESLSSFYQQFIKDFLMDIDKIEIEYIITSEHGLRRELLRKYIKNPKNKSIIDIVDYMSNFRARLYKVDENVMSAYVFNSHEFIKNNDFSSINLL